MLTILLRKKYCFREENGSNNETCNSSFESKKSDTNEKNDTEKDNQNVDNDLEMKKKKVFIFKFYGIELYILLTSFNKSFKKQ